MKKAFSAAGCLLLGALAAWALPLTMVLREPIEALTNSTALLLVALAFALLIRRVGILYSFSGRPGEGKVSCKCTTGES